MKRKERNFGEARADADGSCEGLGLRKYWPATANAKRKISVFVVV